MTADVQVPDEVLDFLRGQHALTLATASGDGAPRAASFLYVNDGPRLYFWTRMNSATAQNISRRSQVGFAIDEYSDDLRYTRGVRGVGECQAVSGEEMARVADLFGQKFPELSRGATVSISFFSITPTELDFIDNRDSGDVAPEGEFGAEFHQKRL